MKRIACTLLICILTCGILAGCANSKSKNTVEMLIKELTEADIPIVYHIVFTDDNDPNGAGEHDYIEKGNFADERLGEYSLTEPKSGSIEIFNNNNEAKKRAEYLNGFTESDELQYQIIKDNILVRLNNAFTEDQVSDYVKALNSDLCHSPTSKIHEYAYSYGKMFVVHAGQLQEEMTLDEAAEIMGFDPINLKYNYYAWYDDLSSNTVYAVVENGKVKTLGRYIKSDDEDSNTSDESTLDKPSSFDESSKISDSDTPTNGNDSRPAGNDNNTASATKPTENKPVTSKAESQKQEPQNPVSSPSIGTAGQSNALKAAKNYLRVMAFSYQGLIQQLEYEGYSHDEAVYGADNCGADWNEQALKSAQNYLSVMPFSYNGLIKQLEYDKYTTEQATYGANNCGANWNEQAVKKAESYLDIMSFSRDSLIRQLEYDGFTHEQAVYGAEANGY